MGDVSEEEIDAEDLDIVECELMETVDADDEGWQSDPDGGDRVEVFNPPRDDATAVFGEHNESVFCMTQPHPGTESIHQHSDLVIVGGMNCLLLAVIKSDKQTALFSSKCLPSILLEDCGSVETMDFSWTHPLFAFGTVSGTIGILDTVPVRIRQKWTYSTSIDEEDDTVGITGLLWSRNTPLLFTSTSDGAVVAWPGLSGSSELVGPAASGPSPLQIWWGHKAMIMDLALSPASSTTRSEQPGRKEFTVEKQIATASDDTTVRIFATTNLMPNC